MSYGNIDYGNGIRCSYGYGYVFDRLFQNLYQNYWWLRSPWTVWDGSAYLVSSSGDVLDDYYSNYGVPNSYGRDSPNTNITTRECFVNPYGDIISGYYVDGSYGSPDRRLTDNGYFCNQYGYIAYDDYGVQYSYGVFSPSMTLSNYAWHGKPSGDVYYNDGDDVDSSYGIRRTRVMPLSCMM